MTRQDWDTVAHETYDADAQERRAERRAVRTMRVRRVYSALHDLAANLRAATTRRATRVISAVDHMPPAGTAMRLQQMQLLMQYRSMRGRPNDLPALPDVRFDVFSPEGEDGILVYIFGLLGFGSRRCVDIGGAGISVSNTANLVVHHDFRALVLDGNEHAISRTARAYGRHRPAHTPVCLHAWITRDNIDALLADHGMAGEIDVLSLDLDGVDWWILHALTVAEPRVLVVEYQDILGPDRAWTVPYRPDFSVHDYPVNDGDSYNYCGAGLRAFVRLLEPRGYRLVGCNRTGYNAFFVRATEAGKLLPEIAVESCFVSDWNRYGIAHRFPRVADMEWTTIPEAGAAKV